MKQGTRAAKARRSAYSAFYREFHNGLKCYYCGDPADSIDHVPAISVAYEIGMDELERRKIRLITVKSCRECNNILGDRPILTTDQRAGFLYGYYQRKYSKILQQYEWEEDEIDEFGACLRSYIVQGMHLRDWIERRLQYMEDIFYDVLEP